MNINLNKSASTDEKRAGYYSLIRDQLDKLYHDIDSGKFGDTAKTGGFYLVEKQ